MPRFFINDECVSDGRAVLRGDDANHISHSLRMRIGDNITLCDFFNYEYDCVIESITSDSVVLAVENKHPSKNEPTVRAVLYQALTKGSKFELIIQKCVELGIDSVVPVMASRCISRPDEKSSEKKTKRWNMISQEAAKQSGRGKVPAVAETVSFTDAIAEMKEFDLSFMCYELCSEDDGTDLKAYLQNNCNESTKSIAFFIGPEGGISPQEAQYAKENGISFVSLGKRILRTETAPLCVLSCIMYETDNMK